MNNPIEVSDNMVRSTAIWLPRYMSEYTNLNMTLPALTSPDFPFC